MLLFYIAFTLIILLLWIAVVGIWWIVSLIKKIRHDINLVQKLITEGTLSLEQEVRNNTQEVRNTTNGVEDTNEFLKTKGFTITFVSGLKDKMEEVIQEAEDKKVLEGTSGPTATPASFTGKP